MHHDPDDDRVLELLHSMEAIEPPGDLPARFRARLAQVPVTEPRRAVGWPLLAAAALAIVLGGGWIAERIARVEEVARLRVELEVAVADLSAAQRLIAVNATRSAGRPDDQLVAVLTRVLLTDRSPSVRIAAVEAVVEIGTPSQVASAITQGLSRESSPLVQSVLLSAASRLDAAERARVLNGFITRTDLDPMIAGDARNLMAL